MGWYTLPTPASSSAAFSLTPGATLAVLGRNDDHMMYG
jgi:hypothetical protein